MGEIQAEGIACEPFSGQEFRRLLQHEIRELTTTGVRTWRQRLPELCAQAGVAVVLTKEIPKAAISGAARWLPKRELPLIQLSLKFKTDDQFWFSFYHEGGHILLHGRRKLFVDYGADSETKEEREANTFARDLLIAREHIAEFPHICRRKARIRQFASRIGVSAGIVVGRLQHDGFLLPSHCNDLKKKYKWA
jgi:Zn-dependent peptidase ImmA (M78 family)